MTGTRVKRFMGHRGIVNAVDVCSEGYVLAKINLLNPINYELIHVLLQISGPCGQCK
jgi:hypothetical protein